MMLAYLEANTLLCAAKLLGLAKTLTNSALNSALFAICYIAAAMFL